MKQNHASKIISPVIIVTLIVISFLSVAIINNLLTSSLLSENKNYVKSIIKEPTQSVYSQSDSDKEVLETDVIIAPYASDGVNVKVNYYSKDDDNTEQELSIIKYENTYVPSTGILYSSENTFDVIAISDGEVVDIKEDNLLGKTIAVKHTDNLTSYYYSLDSINLKVGDDVMQGQILGKSSTNKISNDNNNLLFEVSYQDRLINPEEIFDKTIGNFS